MISPALRFEVNQYALRLGLACGGSKLAWAAYNRLAEVAYRYGQHRKQLDYHYAYRATRERIAELEEINKRCPEISVDNPIHTVFAVEDQGVLKSRAVNEAYKTLNDIIVKLKERIAKNKASLNAHADLHSRLIYQEPGARLRLLYLSLVFLDDMKIGDDDNNLLSWGLAAENKKLNCKRSYLFLAVAHELNWPLSLVFVPHHVYVRWHNLGKLLGWMFPNTIYDYETSTGRPEPVRTLKESVVSGRNKRILASRAYNSRGNQMAVLGHHDWAINAYCQAIDLDPCYLDAYFNRGRAYYYHAISELNSRFSSPDDLLAFFGHSITDYEMVLNSDRYKEGAEAGLRSAYRIRAMLHMGEGNADWADTDKIMYERYGGTDDLMPILTRIKNKANEQEGISGLG